MRRAQVRSPGPGARSLPDEGDHGAPAARVVLEALEVPLVVRGAARPQVDKCEGRECCAGKRAAGQRKAQPLQDLT